MWCVPRLDDEYVGRMEDVLELYERPYDENEPVVCLDERPVQLHGEPRPRSPARPGRAAHYDYEYTRGGTANIFCAVEPLAGKHITKVTDNRKAPEFAKMVAQIVRRSSFDVLSAFSTNLTMEPGDSAIVDPLTTLHTRAVFLAALEKEIQRSERFGHPFALILLDVDHLADINAKHGYGSGDRVLERIGFTVRNYFREQDWVARYAGDSFAVLLPETHREHAEQLADRIRGTVETRLELHDYRSDEQVPVTVSVGVLIAEAVDQSVRAEQLLDDVKEAVDRAKQAGRNRLERVNVALNRSVPPTRDNLPMD